MSEESRRNNSISAEQEIKVLSEISEMVQGSPAEKSSFDEILKHLGKIIDFRSASLYLFSKDNGKLQEICTVGRRVDLIDFVHFEMGSGISAWVAKHGRAIVLNNLRKSKGGTHTKSFLSVPMVFAKEIIGVINLAHDEPDSFTKRDPELVAIAASIIALLVERISYEQILSERDIEIAKLHQEVDEVRRQKTANTALSSDLGSSLYQKLANPLAIISGNAQFLIMTLKAANPSILKRLKAIDKEAGNIADLSQGMMKIPIDSRVDFLYSQQEQVGAEVS